MNNLKMQKLTPLVLSLALGVAFSTPASAEILSAKAMRTIADDRTSSIRIEWAVSEPTIMSLYMSSDPDAATSQMTAIAEGITGTSFESFDYPGQRVYFTLVPANPNHAKVKVASRLLPLEGGRNFRDIGGYETVDGSRVKWGQVFRSGVMTEITPADYKFLEQTNIGTIIDFRSSLERESEPTTWQAGDPKVFARDYVDEGANALMGGLFAEGATAETMKNSMSDLYYEIVLQQAPAYTAMFNDLAATNAGFLFNCSAGKDRTGIAAALILTVLDVPRATIVHDYSLSDDYVDFMKEFTSPEATTNEAYAYLSQIPVELLAPLMASHPEYLESALDYLDIEYGSVMNYIQTELKVTDAEIATIRGRLLEKVN
jgi:protein-tyrosine phosphatase